MVVSEVLVDLDDVFRRLALSDVFAEQIQQV